MAKRMKRERGQTFILVLILLAVGSLMIAPVLCLSSNTLVTLNGVTANAAITPHLNATWNVGTVIDRGNTTS